MSGLHDPTSLDMHRGYLYIGEGSSIARVQLGNDLHAGPVERIITSLPDGGQQRHAQFSSGQIITSTSR